MVVMGEKVRGENLYFFSPIGYQSYNTEPFELAVRLLPTSYHFPIKNHFWFPSPPFRISPFRTWMKILGAVRLPAMGVF